MILSSICIPKVLKNAAKLLKIGSKIKNERPKISLTRYFACAREVIQNSLIQNSSEFGDFVVAFGPQFHLFSIWCWFKEFKTIKLEFLFFRKKK